MEIQKYSYTTWLFSYKCFLCLHFGSLKLQLVFGKSLLVILVIPPHKHFITFVKYASFSRLHSMLQLHPCVFNGIEIRILNWRSLILLEFSQLDTNFKVGCWCLVEIPSFNYIVFFIHYPYNLVMINSWQ